MLKYGIEKLPTLVVLGSGNSVDGVGPGTIANANSAADIILKGLADPNLILAVGGGPSRSVNYPEPESTAIARIIRDKVGPLISPHIEEAPRSYDTIGNIWDVDSFLTQYPLVESVGLVGARGHVNRAALIGRKVLGARVEIVTMYSGDSKGVPGLVKEAALSALYAALTLGIRKDDPRTAREYQLARRDETYRRVIAAPKKLFRKASPNSTRYK